MLPAKEHDQRSQMRINHNGDHQRDLPQEWTIVMCRLYVYYGESVGDATIGRHFPFTMGDYYSHSDLPCLFQLQFLDFVPLRPLRPRTFALPRDGAREARPCPVREKLLLLSVSSGGTWYRKITFPFREHSFLSEGFISFISDLAAKVRERNISFRKGVLFQEEYFFQEDLSDSRGTRRI